MPHIEELQQQEWLLNKDNGLLFLVHPLLQVNSNFAAYSPSRDEIIAGCKLTVSAPVPVVEPIAPEGSAALTIDRAEVIKAAVQSVPSDQYGAPAAGRPAMPKVGAIRLATGLKDVTVEEVLEAMSVPVVATEGE